MRNRFSLSPRLALRNTWLLSSLALALLIVGGIYMSDEPRSANIAVSWPMDAVRLGSSFPVTIKIDGLTNDHKEIIDFYLHLPEDLAASFLPSSLKVLQGSLAQATVLAYSGKKRLIIEDISGDSLALELMVQVSDDIAFAERSFPFAYGIKVNQEAQAHQTTNDHFRIKYVPLQLSHRLLQAPDSSHQWARYEVMLHNPPQGSDYERENGLITLNTIANHPDALIKSCSINGQSRPLPTEPSNRLELARLKLPAGTSLLLHYEVAFPAGVPNTKLSSTATVFVPASIITKSSTAALDASTNLCKDLKLQATKNGLVLSWEAMDINADGGFRLEGSHDGIKFEKLDTLPQKSSLTNEQSYQYLLSNRSDGYAYFRIGLAALDGSMRYSEILRHDSFDHQAYSINFEETDQTAEIQVAIPQQLRIEIRNQLGHTLAVVFEGMLEAGVPYSLDLSMSEFSEGDYLFWMEGEYFKSRRWFIRRRGKWRRFG